MEENSYFFCPSLISLANSKILLDVQYELITKINYCKYLNEDDLKLHNGQQQFSFCQLQKVSDFWHALLSPGI